MNRHGAHHIALVLAAVAVAAAPRAGLAQRGAPTGSPSRSAPDREVPAPGPRPAPTPAPASGLASGLASGVAHDGLASGAGLAGFDLEDVVVGTWPTSLQVCGEVSPTVYSSWLSETVTLYSDDGGLERPFRWSCPESGATDVLWQVSVVPFGDELELMPVGLVASGRAPGDGAGTFSLDFASLVSTDRSAVHLVGPVDPTVGPVDWEIELAVDDAPPVASTYGISRASLVSSVAAGMPRTYFVRATPFYGSFRAGAPSNTVRVDVRRRGDRNPIVLPVPPASPYQVRIVEVEPVRPATMPAGCVYVVGVDRNALRSQYGTMIGDSLYDLYRGYQTSGAPLCPSTDSDEGSFLSEFFDFLVTIASFPSVAYEEIKERFAETLALLWNESLGGVFDLECGETCQDRLVTGIEIGLAVLGVPPELPNARELMEEGLDYLVAEAVEHAGLECDELCRDTIADGIEWLASEFANQTAHSMNPALPWAVRAEPVPESMLRPAELLLEVWRDPHSPADPDETDSTVTVYFPGRNEAIVGESLWISYDTCYYDYGSFPCDSRVYHVTEPLVGSVFQVVSLSVPHLAPGDGLLLPFALHATDYWLPGHRETIEAAGGAENWNDWPYLYQGAEVTVQAAVQCYGPVDVNWTPVWSVCGGSDSRIVTMPDHSGWYRP